MEHNRLFGRRYNLGFTVVEMMISLFISSIIAGAIYMAYQAQQKSMVNQQSVSSMQQDLRAATVIMQQEIREAGTDPLDVSNATINEASGIVFDFSRDIGGDLVDPNLYDGSIDDPNEQIRYEFLADTDGDGVIDNQADTDGDGVADGGVGAFLMPGNITRDTGGGPQVIAQNVEALEFYYMLDDGTQTLNPPNPNKIRSVQMSILVRADRVDPAFTGQLRNAAGVVGYTTPSGNVWSPPTDGFRRRLNVVTIFCRNMGL